MNKTYRFAQRNFDIVRFALYRIRKNGNQFYLVNTTEIWIYYGVSLRLLQRLLVENKAYFSKWCKKCLTDHSRNHDWCSRPKFVHQCDLGHNPHFDIAGYFGLHCYCRQTFPENWQMNWNGFCFRCHRGFFVRLNSRAFVHGYY